MEEIDQVLERIFKYEATLIELRNLTQPFNDGVWPTHAKNLPPLPPHRSVSEVFPSRYEKIYELANELTNNQPPDYEVDADLRRLLALVTFATGKI
jgi:hypothetical protein